MPEPHNAVPAGKRGGCSVRRNFYDPLNQVKPTSLIHHAWIPVYPDERLVSLMDVFEDESIVDLACAAHERIAIMRLLICAAQAAHVDETVDDDCWEDLRDEFGRRTITYLGKQNVEDAFNLFGETRFLQRKNSKTDKTNVEKLFFRLASGNNPTLFDHRGGEGRAFSEAQLALGLLTYQNFSPLIGRGYTGRGPCVESNMLHAFRLGRTLLDTVFFNCVSAEHFPDEDMGKPCWEDSSEENLTKTYLGRLVPLARSIWLDEDCATMVLDNGPLYPSFPDIRQETTATEIILTKKTGDETRYLLSTRLDRAVWRDLDALSAVNIRGRSEPPLVMKRHRPGNHCRLWVGGVNTDYKAKVIDVMESRFIGERALPKELFGDSASVHQCYRHAVQAAETWQDSLAKAVKAFANELNGDAAGLRQSATIYFWNAAEQNLHLLFRLIRDPGELKGVAATNPYADTLWHRSLRSSAHDAFRHACPRTTARQMTAFAKSLAKLWPRNPDKSVKKRPARKESANV